MTDLYLIAHKVRGEPAFDIAHRMPCPICAMDEQGAACHECDSLGYWWIIPTSGHRAYPWWNLPLRYLIGDEIHGVIEGPCPPDVPDHYPHRAEPNHDLVSLLGLIHKPLAQPIKRRF